MKINVILAIVAAVLLILSVLTYVNSVQRAERFERGQKFLSHLNPDEITEITVTKGETTTRLRRSGQEFVVASAHGYPAKNESVNRFVRNVLDLSLEQEVGRSEDLEKELELKPAGEETVEVVFKDANEKEMVHFLVGKAFEGGSGSYVLRTDVEKEPIYLTSSRVYLSTGNDDFLKKEIVDVKQEDVVAIRGADYLIEQQEGELKLAELPVGKKESSKLSRVKSALAGLRFTKHYLADDPEVRGLAFDSVVRVDLKDESGYQVAVASLGEKYYLQIQGFLAAADRRIGEDTADEELQETADLLVRRDEIQDFNRLHGSWIYEITETTAEKFRFTREDLIEDA